jgi:hypothetical protein
VIRRGFWVLVGATGGIMGYRRVTALGRQLSGTISPPKPASSVTGNAGGAGSAGSAGTAGTADQIAAKHDRAALTRQARRGLIRGTIRFTRDARRFSRDVREGMDLYMVRRTTRQSPTLDAGAQSRRPSARPLAEAHGAKTDNDDRVKDDR